MKRSLRDLLSLDLDNAMDEDEESEMEGVEKEQEIASTKNCDSGLCIECGDQPSELTCLTCEEDFCSVCYGYLHRTGKRKNHKSRSFNENAAETPSDPKKAATTNNNVNGSVLQNGEVVNADTEIEFQSDEIVDRDWTQVADSIIATRGDVKDDTQLLARIKEHSKFIPMRLTADERKLLRLLEAALNVSEYTDKVDILMYSSKAKRMIAQLKEMCSILAGLVVATNMQAGQKLFEDKDFAANAEWYQSVFEIGRRYKIMNPEKMRVSFGKLMYMIMDSRLPEVKEGMDFDLYKSIKTVYGYLEERGEKGLSVFDDPLIFQAIVEITPEGKNRVAIQKEIKQKERAIEALARKYSGGGVTGEEIRQCLYSIGDYHAYLRANCHPIDQTIKMLDKYFDANAINKDYSLGIHYGKGGARLSHDHFKQFHYVRQSLTLWSQIMRDMFMLWSLADHDLLSESIRYRLADTGQGLNRIKACPKVGRAMHGIIRKCQEKSNTWIGSSVVHLGDHNVPNALFFLDKYVQVPRILTPVYIVVSNVDRIARDPYAEQWICSQFQTVEDLKITILCDFFKHAFDGSGADNFFDAGSCIDGRLTSAWNWANTISKKPYYKNFLVTGFTGFNGTDGF